MDSLTSFVIGTGRIVGLIWLAALVIGGYASSTLSSHLSQSFEIPGTRSDVADVAIVSHYGSGGSETPLVPVVRLPPGDTAEQPKVAAMLGPASAP